LATSCVACGTPLRPEARFCGTCGARRSEAPTPAARFASPIAYTPDHLAQRIITTRPALEGERKQVTVLFADIKSSLELLADRDPEDARELLDPVLELMMQAVHRYEGTVNQVMGDGIMALFGAPLAHEDHALRACCAALRIQAEVNRHSDETFRTHGVPVQIRIGINSGEVVVRSIGSDLDMDYTAVGQTTHLAGRLEQMAKPGTVLCGPATLRLTEGFLRCRRVGPVPIRGLAQPVEVSELIGIETACTRFHAAIARGLSPFVGRGDEYAAILDALQRAAAGHGQIVFIIGEPGVGKSRLCWEVATSPSVRDWLRAEGGAFSYSAQVPYGALAPIFRTYCGVENQDDPRQARDKVAARLTGIGETGPWALPAFLELLGLPNDHPGWAALDPPRRRHFTTQAIVAWLLRESEARPVLLILEDLHWIDQGTQTVLDALVDPIATARILLLVNCRPEYRNAWDGRDWITVLRLATLPRARAEEFLRGLLGDDASVRGLTALLGERTGGNPLFLEETVRTLVETGSLSGQPSAYRLTGALDRVQVPATVQAILAARIDRLHPDDKWIVQAAAVVGEEVPVALIAAALDVRDEEIRAGMIRLRDAGFVYEISLYPELTYAFAHALIREVAYGGLIHERRRALHERLLTAMESLYAERAAEHVERLAQHAVGAADWPRAVRYFREAGAKAAARSGYQEAAAHLEQALSAVERLPLTPEASGLAIDLRFELRNALYPLGRVAEDRAHLMTVIPVAEALGDEHRLGWLLAYMARDASLLGDPLSALDLGARALAIAERLGERRLRTLTTVYLGLAHHARGEYRRAAAKLSDGIAALSQESRDELLGLPGPAAVFFRAWLVWSLARLGEFADGRQHAAEALEIARSAEHPLSIAVGHYGVGILALFQRDFPRAIKALEASRELCQRWDLRAWFPNVASHLGFAYARSGQIDEGLALLQQAIDKVSNPHDVAGWYAMLAEAFLLAKRGDEAREHADRALTLARAHQERGNEACALWILGEISVRTGTDAAMGAVVDDYTRAMEIATELGMRPLVAHCHAGLAMLYERAGARPQAREHFTTATTIYREIDMRV
jgi:class 3 adenylate cyclase/tetratricopeptide (TPR) repeat protein